MASATHSSVSLGVGIIGAGNILGLHASGFLASPDLARLVAVSDLERARAGEARRRFGFEQACTDHRALLARDDVQVVVVCTRPNVRVPLVRDALEAGKHVLCEKPMAHTLADADEVIALAEQYPKSLVSFMYQWRTDPATRRVRTLVERGRLGRLLAADVRIRVLKGASYYEGAEKRESFSLDGGGVLVVVGIHQLDSLLTFLGEPVEVSARMDTFLAPTEGEDTLVGWVRFASGALATIGCTSCAQRSDFSIEVLGEDASIALHGQRRGRPPAKHSCTWDVRSRDRGLLRALLREGLEVAPEPSEPPRPLVLARDLWCKLRGRRFAPPAHWWHGPAIREFLEAVRDGGPAPVPPREARRSLELAMALYQSALRGGPVSLPLGPESPIYKGVVAPGPGSRRDVRGG